MSTTFNQLQVKNWRQFREVNIDLHPRLTVITGANGSGKSTILSLFYRHFGWSPTFLATPSMTASGVTRFVIGLLRWLSSTGEESFYTARVGSLRYSNGAESPLEIPNAGGTLQYEVQIPKQLQVFGLHVGSHRPMPFYQSVQSIPTSGIRPDLAYSNYHSEVINKATGGHTGYSPTYRMKEALISMAMFGAGNNFVQGNESIMQAYLGFNEVLRNILPDSIGFEELSIRPPDVVLKTRSGDFLIDAASGGLMSLVDLAWRIYLYSLQHESFVVTIDEPENHLHPSMQRTLMGKLINAFPKAQFIVVTHSPFMVSSVRDSNVYVFRFLKDETLPKESTRPPLQVESTKLDTVNRAGSANEILREVLGVETTIPEWVEDNLKQIVETYRSHPLTAESLKRLRTELQGLGYDELFSNALSALTDDKTRKN